MNRPFAISLLIPSLTFAMGASSCGQIPLTKGFWGYENPDEIDAEYADLRFLDDGTVKLYTRRYNPNFDHGCPSSPDGGVYNDGVVLYDWTQTGDVVQVGTLTLTREGDALLLETPPRVFAWHEEPQTPGPCMERAGQPEWP